MYSKTTRDITITVEPEYLDDQSRPESHRFFWSYRVRIENGGPIAVQLRTRHWQIYDASGRKIEVHGPGVVGEQPVLEPGGSFEYTSGTPLDTPTGMMVGAYVMETPDGEWFDVSVPPFSLDSPHHVSLIH